MSIASTIDFSQVKLAGHVVHWATAFLILVFFLQLPKFGAHRQLLPIWIAAWVALVVSAIAPGLAAMFQLLASRALPFEIAAPLDYLAAPARLLFVVFVVVAAFDASHRKITRGTLRVVISGAVIVGAVVQGLDQFNIANHVLVLAMPLLVLGAALVVRTAARGHRSHGMNYLACAMVVFVAGTSLFQLAATDAFSRLLGDGVALRVLAMENFAQAFCVALLASAVVVLVVQDSLLMATEAREEQVREVAASEQRLRQIIEAAGEAILTFDHGLRIRMANAAAGRLFQVPTSALIERRLDQMIEPSTPAPNSELPWWQSMAAMPSLALGRRLNGTSFPAEVTIGPLTDGDQVGGGVAIVRDLTMQRQAVAERERFERQVAESEKMLAIGRVVSGVAHELNNPLAVVLGQSEQLAGLADDVELRAGIMLINEQAQRARHIVRDLLAFVRPSSGSGETVSLFDLARRVAATQAPRAAARGIAITLPATSAPIAVRGDRMGLEQVLTNLVENAIDAVDDGGSVTVRLGSDAQSGRLIVEDNGPGVDPVHIGRIFEPFFTTKGVGQGTGLGLSVSAGLVERQGGTLQLENHPEPGVGARFVVALPLSQEPLPEAGSRVTRVTVAPLRDAAGALRPALVIDDEAAVRATLALMLTRWGWPVVQLDSATEALALLQGDDAPDPAVILCDLRMPGMTGQEFHAALRESVPRLAELMVFVTGDVVETDTADFLRTVDQPVVEKPFTLTEMAQAIEQILAAT